jgi:tetratricopeptide (TPR) repeat protein
MIKKIIFSLFTLFLLISQLHAIAIDMGGNKIDSYNQAIKKIIKANKFEKKRKLKKANNLYDQALNYLYKANKERPGDPDIYSYLGFVLNKKGNLIDAEIYYKLGLEINPSHIKINKYFGELYVKTNRVNEAKERLNALKNCGCEEFNELNTLLKIK